MDLRGPTFYGQMKVSGIAKVFEESGTIMSINAKFLQELLMIQPQRLKGGKSINFVFSENPFTEPVIDSDNLDLGHAGPFEHEDYERYYSRLLVEGLNPEFAKFMADDWFDQPKDTELQLWMADEKVQRFTVLNGSREAFENAIPTEYEMLKQYVLGQYPERAKSIVFRTA